MTLIVCYRFDAVTIQIQMLTTVSILQRLVKIQLARRIVGRWSDLLFMNIMLPAANSAVALCGRFASLENLS